MRNAKVRYKNAHCRPRVKCSQIRATMQTVIFSLFEPVCIVLLPLTIVSRKQGFRLIVVKICTPVSLNITLVGLNITPVSLNITQINLNNAIWLTERAVGAYQKPQNRAENPRKPQNRKINFVQNRNKSPHRQSFGSLQKLSFCDLIFIVFYFPKFFLSIPSLVQNSS